MELSGWVHELRRRRVLRVLVGYALASFAVLQVAEPVMHGLHAPEWALTVVVVALGLGFPLAVALAWAFDLKSTGIERTPPAATGAPGGASLSLVLLALGLAAAAPGLTWFFGLRGGVRPWSLAIVVGGYALLAAALALAWRLLRDRRAGNRGRPAPAEGGAPSIAVLPFADLSPSKDQDYFCDGIAEELLGALCGVPGLRVAARGSSFQFKGRALDSRDIGRTLGVATLLEGSVRKAGNRVRVAAQLVSARDGYQLWSETFDRGLEDIFAIQEEIAQAVVRGLELRLAGGAEGRLTHAGTRNTQAYEMYLRGRKFLMTLGETMLRFARQMFRGAIELDPRFAQAHAGLADADFIMLQWNIDHERAAELRAEALAASEEALRLQPELAEAHVSRANVLSLLGRGEDAERDFRRALELNPTLADGCYFYARHLWAAGRPREAALMFEEAAHRNPEDYAALSLMIGVYRGLGEADRSLATARRALEAVERRLRLNPDDTRALYFGAGALIHLGQRERGLEWAQRAVDLTPNEFTTLYNVACVYAMAGDLDRAFDALDRAVATGRGFRKWMEHDSDLDPLRGDPRFQAILERVGG